VLLRFRFSFFYFINYTAGLVLHDRLYDVMTGDALEREQGRRMYFTGSSRTVKLTRGEGGEEWGKESKTSKQQQQIRILVREHQQQF
jgi:hypothetical protein